MTHMQITQTRALLRREKAKDRFGFLPRDGSRLKLGRKRKSLPITTTNARDSMPHENGRIIFVCKEINTTFQKL
jgi:hypothetical protein